jgi:hypothetical protein
VDLDFPNTTESYKLYSQVCDWSQFFIEILYPLYLIFLEYPFHFYFLIVLLLQRVIASDIKECVCRAPDTPYDGLSSSHIYTF